MNKHLILIVVFLTLVAAACEQANPVDTGTSKEAAPDTSDSRAKEDVLAAARKFTALPFASAKVDWVTTVEGEDTTNSVAVEYASPNRYRTKWITKLGEPDGIEYIGMGKMVYVKTCWRCPDGGKWMKMSEDGGTLNLKELFGEQSLRRIADVKLEGEEMIDGRKASVYSYKNQALVPVLDAVGYMTPSSCKLWVQQDKGLPLKLRADFGDSKVKWAEIVFDVEKPVKIEAPTVSN